MTLNQIVFNILNLARGGISSDDDRLSEKQIKFWIKYYRSQFIATLTDYGKNIDPQFIQDLGCLELTKVDKANCAEAEWGCEVLTTTIPRLVDLPVDRALVYVGLIDKQTPIQLVPASTVGFLKSSRVTGGIKRAYLIGGSTLYIDIPNSEKLKYINVRGVFDDPDVVQTCNLAGTCTCLRDDTDDYPCSMAMVQMITQKILTTELGMSIQVKTDELNNARSDV